jgi:tetratricopeptide (TPR) repeat protein
MNPPSSDKASRLTVWGVASLLALVTLAVYWPATHCDFINFDDKQYVTENPRLLLGLTWENVQWYFSHFYFSNWHPVTSLSYLLDYELWGLNPFGFHLTNILFHALNTALVFLVLWELTSGVASSLQPSPPKGAREEKTVSQSAGFSACPTPAAVTHRRYTMWACALVAALFGLHPLHVESVAWVAERKDVLSGFFGLLTLWAYARHVRRKGEDGGTLSSPRPSPHLAPPPPPNAEREKRSQHHNMEMHRVIQAGKVGSPLTPDITHKGGEGEKAAGQSMAFRHPQSAIRNGHRGYFWLALAFFALGLMSKPMLVTWPFVLLLLDFWPLKRVRSAEGGVRSGKNTSPYDPSMVKPAPHPGPLPIGSADSADAEREKRSQRQDDVLRQVIRVFKPLLVEKIPFFALAAVSCVVTYLAQQQSGATVTAEDYPLGDRIGNAMISYCRYLGKTFWPTDMAVLYPYPGEWPMGQVLLAAVLLAAVSWWCWRLRRRQPFLLTGWLWFLGTLVPVIGLVQAGKQAMADRYTYLPLLGIFIAVVWGVFELAARLRRRNIILTTAGAAVIVLCALLTWRQLGYWKDSVTIYRHTLAVTTNNAVIHYNLGTTLCEAGKLDEAIGQFQEAIRIRPNFAGPRNNLAVALVDLGRLDEAIGQYAEALHLEPDNANTHFNLAVACFKQGLLDDALRQFQEAARLNPADTECQARVKLLTELQRVIVLGTNDPGVLNNTAWELATSSNPAVRSGGLAVRLAERACELTQRQVTVMLGTLAAAYAEAGRFDDAVATAEKACALARQHGETELLKRNEELRELYRQHQPYREKP